MSTRACYTGTVLAVSRIPYIKEAALAKLHCTEMAKRAADSAVQIFGGLGYMDDAALSRCCRDIRAATIAGGTSEIQKHIIARETGAIRQPPQAGAVGAVRDARRAVAAGRQPR